MTANRSRKTRSKRSADPVDASDGEQRLAVNLPLHLHRQLKARVAEQGTTIREYILELLRKSGIR